MLNIEKVIENFEIIKSDKALKILINNIDKSENNVCDKILYIVAGPNGSGKSTLIVNCYKQKLIDVKYINADIFVKTIFNNIKDEKEKNYRAMYYTIDKVKSCLNQNQSLIYETVLSHPSKLEIINEFKEKGFKIFSIFITPNDPNINIERVKKRVNEGGHNVPQNKIIERYYRSNKLKNDLKLISDEYYEIDNTNYPKIIDIKESDKEESK